MGDWKTCSGCERNIDAFARLCPYCNRDQTQPLTPQRIEPRPAAATYVPPDEKQWRKPAFIVISFVALLIASFALGSLVHGRDPKIGEEETKMSPQASAGPVPRAIVTLVPDDSPIVDVEEPITTAPVDNPIAETPSEYQRNDATALSSAEYAQLAVRARAEKPKRLLDPRAIGGAAYSPRSQPTSRRTPAKQSSGRVASSGIETRAVPIHQPLPVIRLPRDATARLQLTVGADGRVTSINVKQPLPGETSRLIRAVQSWRFRPATRNGMPVAGAVNVDIVFNKDD